jgi:beta-galactosidase
MAAFEVTPGGFRRDGQARRVLSGALHYFRVLPQQWPHRLATLRAIGLNTVETYVPWNLHEPSPGEHDFTGSADLPGFLDAAADAGLDAIVRPGPYICAEWDNGGLPSWLTGRPGIRLRCMDSRYLAAVDSWFDVLIPIIAAHQATRDRVRPDGSVRPGNVIMVQVENEYGSYGSDAEYLRHLADGLTRRGVDVPLFTSDGPEDHMLTGGTVPGLLATVNFGNDPEAAFATLAALRPNDPPFCMEYWNGWFDHWGGKHATRDAADAAQVLDRILRAGGSVNLYMAHGGTNFGTWAGANRSGPFHDGALDPDVTSYDYDAPLDERGAPTAKFTAYRDVLARFADGPLPPAPPMPPVLAPRQITLPESVRLLDVLATVSGPAVRTPMPPSFEELGIEHGLVLYRCTLPGPRRAYPLTIDGLADRAHLFVDGTHVTTLDPASPPVDIDVPAAGRRIDLLVESMGRVNYGPLLGERKGITGAVRHERQHVHGFTSYPISLRGLPPIPWPDGRPADPTLPADLPLGGPVLRRGWLEVAEPADCWLAVPEGGKGYLWVNGFCLGRYWERGPQQALYLPWPLLAAGRNEIVLLELNNPEASAVRVQDHPDLG